LPYAGITGLTAFAHHIPDNGSALIFYGPHIGVTLENEVGKMYRPRQENAGACCGALMLALERLKDDKYKPEIKSDDYQQSFLESLLYPHREEIINDKSPEIKITECTFEIIDQMLHEYLREVKHEFKVDKICLLGGIVINTDFGIDDYFSVRNFEVIRTRYL
jgi:hydrogenase maturation factor HypF (carbamoyltransferase family)